MGPTFLPRRVEPTSIKGDAIFRLIADECGATAIEYTLIVGLIALAAIILIAQIGSDVIAPFQTIAGAL